VPLSFYSQRLFRVLGLVVLTFGLLSLVRLQYLVWNFAQFQGQSVARVAFAFLVGLRFDAAAVAWLNLPLLLFVLVPWPSAWERGVRGGLLALAVLIHVPFLLFNLVDVEFVNFVGRRMTADVLFLLGEAQGKAGGFVAAYGWLMAFNSLFFLLLGFGIWWVLFRWIPFRPSVFPSGRVARSLFAFLVVCGFVVASRGGLQNKPVSFVDANLFAAPLLNNLVLNTSFNLLKNLNQENLPRAKYFENRDEMLALLNGSVAGPSLLEGLRPSKPQNVMIIMLESFGLEYMGEVNGEKGYTPFLDSLARRGLFFKNGFANGRRSIEGIAAVMAGIPAMMNEPFVSSPFTANRFLGLGTLLGVDGYHTSFFHGGNNGTMHFDAFMRSVGVEHYFGASEYPNQQDHDGVWGIYDGPFMNWMETQLNSFPQPFLSSFFSISSHQPYLIPPDVQSRYPEGPLPILKTIAYTDDSLREFFERASKESWYKDTLFVITADHTYRAHLPRFDNELSRYRVPILFFHEGFVWPAGIDRDQVVQHIDVLPSVMDFLGKPLKESILLGRSVFVPGPRSAAVFLDGNYFLVEKDRFLYWPRGEEPLLFATTDAGQTMALQGEETERERLWSRLKAAIQYFSEGMWDNRLYAPSPAL
jgi:phosphoglycerol transferase MdoB-like AlkP superfamily enzyme